MALPFGLGFIGIIFSFLQPSRSSFNVCGSTLFSLSGVQFPVEAIISSQPESYKWKMAVGNSFHW